MVTDVFVRITLSLYHIPAYLFIYSFDIPLKDRWNGGNLRRLHTCFLFNILVENLKGWLGPKHTSSFGYVYAGRTRANITHAIKKK